MQIRKITLILTLVLIASTSFAATIIQLNENGDYVWYLNTYEGSGALGAKLTFKVTERRKWLPIVKECSLRAGIDWKLVDIVLKTESAYNKDAESPKGAYGFMQLMEGTAAELNVDRKIPKQNICGGAKYLSLLHKSFNDLNLTLAAYNAGAGNVRKYNGIPPFEETETYVKKVLDDYTKTSLK